jgi:hypothetical protein
VDFIVSSFFWIRKSDMRSYQLDFFSFKLPYCLYDFFKSRVPNPIPVDYQTRMVNIFQVFSPISYKHMSLWLVATYHSITCVWISSATKLDTFPLVEYACKEACLFGSWHLKLRTCKLDTNFDVKINRKIVFLHESCRGCDWWSTVVESEYCICGTFGSNFCRNFQHVKLRAWV